MADNIAQNLNLEKILATLAGLSKSEPEPYQGQQNSYHPNQSYQGFQNEEQPYPTEQIIPYHQTADPRLANRPAPQHRQHVPQPPERSSTPLIDPSTITEWKQGLRCVSKVAVQNPDFVPAVRKVLYPYHAIL